MTATADRSAHYREMQLKSARARSVRRAEDHLRRLVQGMPPLTAEQKARLVALLVPGDAA